MLSPLSSTEEMRGSMEEIPLQPYAEISKDTEKNSEENYCPHYERSTCLLRFFCCEQDVFFPCHKCHNDSIACEPDVPCELLVKNETSTDEQGVEYDELRVNESTTGSRRTDVKHHSQAKCSDAIEMKCTDCLELQEIGSKCTKCSKEFAPYFCCKCKIFVSDMKMDPYHCDGCGICRADKSNHIHCYKCNFCLDKQLYEEHKCMEDSAHDMCAVCLETVFNGCYFLPCDHKIHQKCTKALVQHGNYDCPICRSTFVHEKKKEIGRCEAITTYLKTKGRNVLRLLNVME